MNADEDEADDFPLEEDGDSGGEYSADEDENENDGEVNGGNESNTGAEILFKNFDIRQYLDRANAIDLEDTASVRNLMESSLSGRELESLRFSRQDEEALERTLPSNDAATELVQSNRDMDTSVNKHRGRYQTLIDNHVKFMLAIGEREKLPKAMRGWFLLVVANAKKRYRERLRRMLTHPSVQPLAIQYILGQDEWSLDMFDHLHKIDLEITGEPKDFMSSYCAIGHFQPNNTFVYFGSATNTRVTSSRMGEEDRISEHSRTLKIGHAEIKKRRSEPRGKGSAILLAHEKLSLSQEEGDGYYFFASQRYPVHMDDPEGYKKAAALALLSEHFNVMLLGSIAEGYTPRKHANQDFITISRQLMSGLRPDDFPTPVFTGTNVVLPVTQVPRAFWHLLQQDTRVLRTEELVQELQDHFQTKRKLLLTVAECKTILPRHQLPATPANVKALRMIYASLLHEKGLKYQTHFQANFMKKMILVTAVIQVAEARGLAYKDGDTRFGVEEDGLDWIKVEETAQKHAPEALRDLYTAKACERLWKSPRTATLREQVALAPNWVRVRAGVPKTFVKSRRHMKHPLPIKLRIQDLARFHMYWNMFERDFFDDSQSLKDASMVKLMSRTPPTATHLVPPMIEQLRADIALSSQVKVRDGAWENPIFREHLLNELHRAQSILRSGIQEDEVSQWKSLQKLQVGWAHAPAEDDEDRIILSEPQMQKPTVPLTTQSHDIQSVVEMLQRHHIELPQTSRTSHPLDTDIEAQADDHEDDEDDEPFDFYESNGEPISRTLFTMSGSSGGTRRRQAMPPEPEDSGVCGRCRMFTKTLSSHHPYCTGRCEECVLAGAPCAHPPGRKTCVRCERLGKKCENFSNEEDAEPKATEVCDKCEAEKPSDGFYNHYRQCRGRCRPCIAGNRPCVRVGGVSMCETCTSPEECTGHSHGDDDSGVCSECLDTKANVTAHERRCRGRCEPCRDGKRPCKRKHGARKCDTCKTVEECCNFQRENPMEEKEVKEDKQTCAKCRQRFDNNTVHQVTRHQSRCPGRCTECKRKKKPCVREKGYTKCENCREDKSDPVCKPADRLTAGHISPTCEICGKSFANKDSCRRHEGKCVGKCSKCDADGQACLRPTQATSRLPCQRCKDIENGENGENCDGVWRSGEKRKRK
ncbi:hypothetical protein ACHAPJ_004519 [Fusarium lateritium]